MTNDLKITFDDNLVTGNKTIIAEIVLMPSSNLINQTIKGAGFRDKFNVNVLEIGRAHV